MSELNQVTRERKQSTRALNLLAAGGIFLILAGAATAVVASGMRSAPTPLRIRFAFSLQGFSQRSTISATLYHSAIKVEN